MLAWCGVGVCGRVLRLRVCEGVVCVMERWLGNVVGTRMGDKADGRR
jgi:hypothetical protein